ncbi:MAG: YjjG family noncanonical pyrimidine nucleotidase [Lachnospiraceae bacterium]|nr:YjjG family noncanonical pyrimidine nucleotidase [Lachnospiraceae bacterium]
MSKTYRDLMLDMDGTFLDFEAAENNAFYTAMEKFGYTATEEDYQIYKKINQGYWEAHERGEISREALIIARFTSYFEQKGIDQDGAEFEEVYQELLGQGHELIKDAWEVLEYLKSKYRLFVVTNGVESTQRNRLHLSGIEKFMDDIFISGCIGVQKPQKEFFDYCFAHMENADPEHTIVIGDSLTSDIQGGMNAGIDTCWFNPKGKARPQTGAGSLAGREGFTDLEIGSLKELKDIL